MKASLLSRWIGVTSPRRKSRTGRGRYRPLVEVLEERALPSSYHVTNTGDSGPGSLRQAILDVNANAGNGRNIIDFTPKVTAPIDLLTALPAIDNDVTLMAPGDKNVTVERSTTTSTDFRIFTINSGRTVTIKGLTIANGRLTGFDAGAGILNQGTLDLEHSILSGNTSYEGGGIDNEGTLTAQDSVFKNNSAVSGGGLLNGRLITSAASAVVENCVFTGNTSYLDAAISSVTGTSLKIDKTVFNDNSSRTFGFGAGAVRSGTDMTIITDSLFTGNVDGVSTILLQGSGNVLIEDTVIAKNRNSSRIGTAGIFDEMRNGKVVIQDSTLTGNVATNSSDSYNFTDGAIVSGDYGVGDLEILNSTITGNIGGISGGVGIVDQSHVLIQDTTISNNTGGRAGGVDNNGFADLHIIRSTISGNTAMPSYTYLAAGGVVVLGPVTIDNSTISGNTVVADQMVSNYGLGVAAGGVLVRGNGFGPSPPSSIDHSTIAFNKVTGAPSGIPEIAGGVASQTQTLVFTYNGNTYSYPFDATVSVHDTIIAKNQASLGEPDVAGAFQSQGHNLIGVLGSGASGFLANDLHGTPSASLDPRLLPLGWYGGPTQTHLLAPDSPAINAGDNSNAPPTDQRGQPRIVGGTIDIGSVERGPGDARYQAGSSAGNNSDLAATLLDAIFAKHRDLLDWQNW